MGIIKVALKTGICVYAVKYTIDEGVWKSADDAIKFKSKVCKSINDNEHYQTGKAHFQTYVPLPEFPQLPERSELCYVTTHYYNQGVKGTIRFIKMTPCYIGQGIKKASDGIKQLMNAPPAATETK